MWRFAFLLSLFFFWIGNVWAQISAAPDIYKLRLPAGWERRGGGSDDYLTFPHCPLALSVVFRVQRDMKSAGDTRRIAAVLGDPKARQAYGDMLASHPMYSAMSPQLVDHFVISIAGRGYVGFHLKLHMPGLDFYSTEYLTDVGRSLVRMTVTSPNLKLSACEQRAFDELIGGVWFAQ